MLRWRTRLCRSSLRSGALLLPVCACEGIDEVVERIGDCGYWVTVRGAVGEGGVGPGGGVEAVECFVGFVAGEGRLPVSSFVEHVVDEGFFTVGTLGVDPGAPAASLAVADAGADVNPGFVGAEGCRAADAVGEVY